jgi:hypothetical protein
MGLRKVHSHSQGDSTPFRRLPLTPRVSAEQNTRSRGLHHGLARAIGAAPASVAPGRFATGLLRIEDSKNREARQFPFTPEVRSILKVQRARTTAMEETTGQIIPWVFWRRKGPGVGREGQQVGLFRRAWITACRKAGATRGTAGGDCVGESRSVSGSRAS